MLYIWLKFRVFHKGFHSDIGLWLKFLLFHKSFPENTKFFWAYMICAGRKTKVYIKSIGQYIYIFKSYYKSYS